MSLLFRRALMTRSISSREWTSSVSFRVEIRVLSPISFAEDTELYLLNMSPGAVLESEAHSPGCMEILAVASGSFRVTAGKRSTVLEKGDVLTYQCDVPHRIENVAESPSQLYMTVKFA